MISQQPAQTDVFDEHTEVAVRALQARSQLEPTGVVDAQTRELLDGRFCGVPDGALGASMDAGDVVNKFYIKPAPAVPLFGNICYSMQSITFCRDVVSCAQAKGYADAIEAAMDSWAATTEVSFEHQALTGCAWELAFGWGNFTDDPDPCRGIAASYNPNTHVISINGESIWSFDGTPAANE